MIKQLGDTIESRFARIEDKLSKFESAIFRSSIAVNLDQRETSWTEDQIITIVRRVMRDMIVTMANDATDTSRSEQNEKSALRVANEALIAWHHSEATKSGADNDGTNEEAKLPYQRFSQTPSQVKSKTSLALDRHYTVTRKCWLFRWSIGTFRAQYRRTRRSEFSKRDNFVISLKFIPSIPIIGLCAEFKSSSGPTAFAELSTNIRPLNVISKDAPIFGAIRAHDVLEVRRLLSERLASPFDIDPDGYTPLHRAAMHGDPTICQDLISLQADFDANVSSLDPGASTRPVDLLHVLAFIKDFADFGQNAKYDACLRVLDRNASLEGLEGESEEMSNLVFVMGNCLEEICSGNFPQQLPGFAAWVKTLHERGRRYSIPRSSDERYIQLHDDACSIEPTSLFRSCFQCQIGVSPNWPSPHAHLGCLHFLAINGSKMTKSLFLAKLKLFLDHGADLYMLTANGQLPIVTAWKFDCADIFKEGLKEYGTDWDEFGKRCREAWAGFTRREAQKEGMKEKSGGGLSTTWALDDLVPSSAGLLARRPRGRILTCFFLHFVVKDDKN